ncbi:restriction endonuclease subunit S [Staphylococcus pseudintermedius]|nr:restriction endonuclease subunit S [Staphylococcus pseudintermedius]
MMEEKQLVPKRRFKEFEGEWKKKNFDEEIELYSGLTYSPNDVQQNGTFVLRSSNVQNGEIVSADDVYVDSEVVNSSNVREGDIIVVVRNGSRSLIGKHAKIKKSMDKTVIGAFMTGVRSNQPYFINALLDTQNFKREIDKNLGATINQITNGMFKSMNFIIPSVKEQQKIGEFFKVLDERIANQKRKIAKVKALKSAYLTEMFPQEGETLPRRRFKGFEGKWELIKFKDIGNVKRGLTYKPSDVSTKGVRVLRSSNIEDNNFVLKQDDVFVNRNSIGIEYADNNNILITAANGSTKLIGKHAITKGLSQEKNVPGGFMLIVETNVPNFLNASMYTDWYKKFLTVFVSGGNGSIGNLSKGDLEEQGLLIPNKQEQQKIGKFFNNLDNQIETEGKKLDKLQKMKEAYLEEMFV